MDLFKQQKDLPKIELSLFEPPKVKIQEPKLKKEKRINKVSSDDIPMFKSEEERLKRFPNNPPKSLKQLRNDKDNRNRKWN